MVGSMYKRTLTAREQEVLDAALAGQSVAETAAALGISRFTVEAYRRTIRAKLKISSLTAAEIPSAQAVAP